MPDDCGSTRPSTISAAIAASTALPPWRRISIAASTACGFAAVTIASPRDGAGAGAEAVVHAASTRASASAAHLFKDCLSNIRTLPRRAKSKTRKSTPMARPGPDNSLADVQGLSIGCADDEGALTGVTVIVPDERA